MSYSSFSFMFNKKKVMLKQYGLERGCKKILARGGGLIMGVLEIFQKGGGA